MVETYMAELVVVTAGVEWHDLVTRVVGRNIFVEHMVKKVENLEYEFESL